MKTCYTSVYCGQFSVCLVVERLPVILKSGSSSIQMQTREITAYWGSFPVCAVSFTADGKIFKLCLAILVLLLSVLHAILKYGSCRLEMKTCYILVYCGQSSVCLVF